MNQEKKGCGTTKNISPATKTAVIISSILFLLLLGSISAILLPTTTQGKYVADLYQNGMLIRSIPLYEVTESYSFEIVGDDGCSNLVEVHPGSIAIVSADCPDKLCVHQGAVSNTLLPITCLPNRLVIQLRAVESPEGSEIPGPTDSVTPDIITY